MYQVEHSNRLQRIMDIAARQDFFIKIRQDPQLIEAAAGCSQMCLGNIVGPDERFLDLQYTSFETFLSTLTLETCNQNLQGIVVPTQDVIFRAFEEPPVSIMSLLHESDEYHAISCKRLGIDVTHTPIYCATDTRPSNARVIPFPVSAIPIQQVPEFILDQNNPAGDLRPETVVFFYENRL